MGNDVAEILGFTNPSKALHDHVGKENRNTLIYKASNESHRTLLWAPNDYSNKVIINESGVYSLIFGSHLPEAKRFKHWVTSEVLPQIHKTGGYIPVSEQDDEETLLQKALAITQRTMEQRQSIGR